MAERIQQRRVKGWRKPNPEAMSVSRSGPFGNPFRADAATVEAHAAAVAAYREWITAPAQADLLARARRELRGRDLMCFCAPHLPCHADVLLELVNAD